MKHNALRYFLVVCSSLLISSALLILTVRSQLLNPDLYKDALYQSNIYEVSTNILESKVSDALVSLQKQLISELSASQETSDNQTILRTVALFGLEQLVQDQTPKLVERFSDKIGVSRLFQQVAEEAIDADIEWLRGERDDPNFFKYIPSPDQVRTVKESSLVDYVDALALRLSGVNNLPLCQTQEELNQNLQLVSEGRVLQVSCTSEEIEPLLKNAATGFVPQQLVENLDTEIQNSLDVLGIQSILNEIYEISLSISQAKQAALQLRAFVQSTKETGFMLLLASLPFLIGAVVLSKGRRLETFLFSLFWPGVMILIVSVIYYVGFSNYFIVNNPFAQIETSAGVLSFNERLLISQSLQSVITYIVRTVGLQTFYVGLMTVIISGVGLIVARVFLTKPEPVEQLEILSVTKPQKEKEGKKEK